MVSFELEPLPFASATQATTWQMPSFFKSRRQKGPKVTSSTPSQNATPSTSTLASAEQSDLIIEGIDWPSEIAGITKSISEGSSLLAPIKATCALIIRGLELTRGLRHNQSDSEGVVEILKTQEKEMEALAERLQAGDKKASPALQSKLETYLKTIQEALAQANVPTKPPKRKRLDFLQLSRPTTSAHEETPTSKQKLDVSYQLFMDAVLLITSNTIEEQPSLGVINSREAGATKDQPFPDMAVEVDKPRDPRDHRSFNLVVQDNRSEAEKNSSLDSVNNEPPGGDTSEVITAVDVAIDIALILREASEASSVLVPLKVVCTVIAKVLQDTREKLVTNINLKSLVDYLGAHYKFIEQEAEESENRERKGGQHPPQEEFLNALCTYLKVLDATRIEVTSWEQQKQIIGVHASSKTALGSIAGLEAELEKSFNELLCKVHGEILSGMVRASSGVAMLRLSHLLKGAINARGERVKPLTPGTRLSLIERLSVWGVSKETHEQIFWLHDEAGTGKSTLAAHMAKHWEIQGVLAARFFFDRNGGRNLRRLDRFCVTLAQEISDHHPLAQATYIEIFDKSPSAEELPFSEAFQLLVIPVAERLSKRLPKPVIFVIDALDECHEDDIQLLISSIFNALPGNSGIRFLLTSRPTKEITSILDGISGVAGKGVVLLDVKHGEAERDHDTSIYVRHTLKDFSTMDQNLVIQCASGVFLWASLACETLLRTITPRRVLEKFQNNTPDKTMQTLYEAALEAALPPDPSSHDLKLLHTVLQGVTLTYTPISIFSVQTFFPSHKDATVDGEEFVEFFVKKLGSIMKDGTPFLPIYILHPTFREFLEDQKSGAKFYISPPDGHYNIAVASLALLTDSLTPNVLSLDDGKSPLPVYMPYGFEPPARLGLDTEAPLRYAVGFWATHASLALGEEDALHQLVQDFLRTKLLVWIEWSSAIRELSECIEGLRRLIWAIRVQGTSKLNSTTEIWCNDSLQFLLRNNHIIDRCGLQAWMSALVFSPKTSVVFRTFVQRSLRPLPYLLTNYIDASSHGGRVLWDTKEFLNITTFSPDGKRLLALGRVPACLWDAKSLKPIKELKNAHGDWVIMNALVFSSDGSLIASGNDDATLCLWDGFTGVFKEYLPRRHSSRVLHVEFILSDSVMVAVDNDNCILCWSVMPTRSFRGRAWAMQGTMHTAQVAEIASSPDGKLFATFSLDKTIKLWDPERATSVGRSMIATDRVVAGSFSVDGTKIVAGYDDGVVAIWDVASQTVLHELKSGCETICDIAVSPDGRTIVSGDDYLCLWDIETGEMLCEPLEAHAICLSFNRSGSRLVSGSAKNHVTIWDIHSSGKTLRVEKRTLKGHSSYINAVASSPSGTLIASASDDGTLRVWDTDMLDTSHVGGSDPTHQRVTSLAVSKDGKRLVSGGKEGTFQIWDFVTGEKVGQLFHSTEGEASILVFSSSSKLWGSSHSIRSGGNVCVWECQTDDVAPTASTLPCNQEGITFVEFTEDNTHVITGGNDQSIRSWNVSSRDCVAKFDCGSIPRYVGISHDGRYLASTSQGPNFSVWDLESQKLVGTKSVERDAWSSLDITFIAFSPDGSKIITKYGSSIQLFDRQDALRCWAVFDPGYKSDGMPSDWRPAFSLDGGYLFYWSYVFNLSSLPQDAKSAKLHPEKSEVLPLSPVSPLFLNTTMGRIHSSRWREALLVIPADVKARAWVAHGNTIGFGSLDGRVFIIRFPEKYF